MTRAAGTIAGGIAQSLAAVLAAVLFPAAAAATTIFTDFGPGQSFASISGVVNGSSVGAVSHVDAAIFQASGTFTLTSIDLAVSVTSGTDSFTVEIADNNPGMIGGQPSHPGTVLESFTLSNIPSTATVETLTSILHPTLSNGTFYWIAVFPGGPIHSAIGSTITLASLATTSQTTAEPPGVPTSARPPHSTSSATRSVPSPSRPRHCCSLEVWRCLPLTAAGQPAAASAGVEARHAADIRNLLNGTASASREDHRFNHARQARRATG